MTVWRNSPLRLTAPLPKVDRDELGHNVTNTLVHHCSFALSDWSWFFLIYCKLKTLSRVNYYTWIKQNKYCIQF